nr:immunoglobulin heavy chain junction region [Homo sapiens]
HAVSANEQPESRGH